MKQLCIFLLVAALISPQGVAAQDLIADLQIDKSVLNDTVQVGETVEFILTVTNGGPDVATGVIVQDALPSELTFVTASHPDIFDLTGSMLTWNVGLLEVGLPSAVTFQATVNGPVDGGAVINSATVSSDVFDADESNNAGEVLLTVSSGGVWSDPSVMVQIDVFCIDKYEASLATIPATTRVGAISVAGVLPTVNISQVEAQQACRETGKRLCTDSEWLRACRGPSNFIYPYGDTLQPGICNDLGTLAETGVYPGCVSAEGALDMVGNVGEWTFDPSGTFRGGYFADIALNGSGCLYRTTAHNVNHTDPRLGFRCCADDCASTLQVEIDIKPGSEPNCFNVNGHGVIPVAILGSQVLDVSQVDPESLIFGGLQVRIRGNKGPLCHMEDTNGDGFSDLVCQFEDEAENWSAGDANAQLDGTLFDGRVFTASDSICVVP